MQTLAALACGIVFGAGLALSGMTNPAKVLAFLDVSGSWDATLAFVMGGALAVNAAAYAMTRRRATPLFAAAFALPARRELDAPLLGGAALFGIGWGLAGLCPGPALANLARGEPRVGVFVAAMVVGMLLQRAAMRRVLLLSYLRGFSTNVRRHRAAERDDAGVVLIEGKRRAR